MADQADKPEETTLPASLTGGVPVEAPVAEGADAQPAPVAQAPVSAEEPAVAEAPEDERIPASETPAEEPAVAPSADLPVAAAKVKKAVAASLQPKPVTIEPPVAPAAKAPVAKAAKSTRTKPAAARAVAAKPKTAKPVRKAAAKPVPIAAAKPASKTKPKTVNSTKTTPSIKRAAGKPASPQIKEPVTMAKTTPTDFIASFQNVFGDLQTKAASAYEKSTSALGEVNDFTKGNVEAIVESSKILASGLQDLSATIVADSRSAFDVMTAEVKDLAAVKTPAEFFSLQNTLARKNFDSAVAQFSKSTEAMLKLANDAMSPISGRVTLAVEKVSKAA